MSYKFVYRSVVLTRDELDGGDLHQVFENGDQLVAIVPYSSNDRVTVVLMKRVAIEAPAPSPIDVTELTNDGVINNAPTN